MGNTRYLITNRVRGNMLGVSLAEHGERNVSGRVLIGGDTGKWEVYMEFRWNTRNSVTCAWFQTDKPCLDAYCFADLFTLVLSACLKLVASVTLSPLIHSPTSSTSDGYQKSVMLWRLTPMK